MSARGLAWAAAAITAGLAAATTTFGFLDDGTRLPPVEGGGSISGLGELTFSLMIVCFCALGALLASRRPRNPLGWILCGASVALGVTGLARGWYVHAYYADPGSLPPPDALLWIANTIWIWGFMPLITALLLLFPDGRLPSRRWWPVAALTGFALLSLTVGYAFEPGPMDSYPLVENPLATRGTLGDVMAFLQFVGFPAFGLAAIGSAAAVAARFRGSRGVERQQLKWMAAAAALAVLGWIVNTVLDETLDFNTFFLPIVLLAIPAAATLAVLRYRLYDLGLVVNRTLVYGALTATLAAAYLGCVLLFQAALAPLTQDSGLAVAASTLAVAALVRPARARIQAVVDRRFYRRRYDAARTLETFAGRLREEVELESLTQELRAAVRDTVQPAHVSLWLRS